MPAPITYKTHFLLGFSKFGADKVVARWEYPPTGKEVQDAIAALLSKDYTEFVLTAPVGDTYPGNYIEPVYAGDYCG